MKRLICVLGLCCGLNACILANADDNNQEPLPKIGILNLGVQVKDEEGNYIEGAPIEVFFSSTTPEKGNFN